MQLVYDDLQSVIFDQQKQQRIDIVTQQTGDKEVSFITNDGKYLLIGEQSAITCRVNSAAPDSHIDVYCILPGGYEEKTVLDMKVNLQHSGASANIYILSLLGEKSDVTVDGGIVMQPGLAKLSGHLLEENVLLGKRVKLKTLPMLDVQSNDVSASHGAKIDTIDATKLFYMTAKGISAPIAQRLIVNGYLTNVFAHFGDDAQLSQLQERIMHKFMS